MLDVLTREEALQLLKKLENQDLRILADSYGITVFNSEGKFNKGWAGHTIERYLGLAANSRREPDFGDWELKVVPLAKNKAGKFRPKETMSITTINPTDVSNQAFFESHLYKKLRKMLIVGRSFLKDSKTSFIIHVETFDFDDYSDLQLIEQIKNDYEKIQQALISGIELKSSMGSCIQPRSKGQGGNSPKYRGFYKRTTAIAKLLKLG